MNAVLFQFIEARKIPWNAARRNNTQMEKEKTGDAGINTLVLIENTETSVTFLDVSLTTLRVDCYFFPSGVGRFTVEVSQSAEFFVCLHLVYTLNVAFCLTFCCLY